MRPRRPHHRCRFGVIISTLEKIIRHTKRLPSQGRFKAAPPCSSPACFPHLPSCPRRVPGINDAFRIWLTIRVLMDRMEMYKCAHPLSNSQQFRLSCTAPLPPRTHTHPNPRPREPESPSHALHTVSTASHHDPCGSQGGNSKRLGQLLVGVEEDSGGRVWQWPCLGERSPSLYPLLFPEALIPIQAIVLRAWPHEHFSLALGPFFSSFFFL